jgi:hypothetical protein
MLPFFEPVKSRMVLKTMTLSQPYKVKFIMEGLGIEVTQMIPKEQIKNEYWIRDSLKKEAQELFKNFQPMEVIINLYYNE